MSPQLAFAISIAMSFLTWILVAVRFMRPWLRAQSRSDALRPILLVHSTRFVGLAFLIPGVVSTELSPAFAEPAAYGDLGAAILALLSLAALRSALGVALTFVFNIWGALDLLYAYYTGNLTGVGVDPGLLGAMYFVPTVIVLLLLVTHALSFVVLFSKERGRRG